MISDQNLEFATAWTPTPAASTSEVLTTTWDCAGVALTEMTDPTDGSTTIAAGTALDRAIAHGEPIYMVFTVNAVATAGGSGSSLRVGYADTDTGGSFTDICTTPSFNPTSGITVGQQIALRLDNPMKKQPKRYLAVQIFNGAGATLAGLSLQVRLVHGDQTGPQISYPTTFISPK